ncbi:MAG: hypothetical protein KF760_05585 [Candidatus Eremiobacteraeota bacterium]|nr:hypothetical protein [Candidatus Eremiobacteraeota bacterium]MCW5870053.1 hypothetical protein [Candidatus Eremiobacteraeota bacterium]
MSLVSHSRRWWHELDFFAPDVLRDLGRLFLQLERAFSSLAARPQRGEPAGWSGLARRGGWDRLVHSEWGVAEVAPEEFVRRAGEGELSFWETAQQADARQDLLWCWLDVGPDQLGACRLVQLALMFYLQHLVLRGSGKFCWGCIQSPQRGYDALGIDEVRLYLSSRSVDPGRRPPDPGGLNCWCIGSPAWLTQVQPGYQKVALEQTGPESVQLTCGARRLQLQLPPGERAARLLRDPFSQQREPAVAAGAMGAGLLSFSSCGRKLVMLEEGTISLIPLPSSVSEPPGKVRCYQLKRPGRVVAFSWERNSLHVCQEHQGQWSFYRVNPANLDQEKLLTTSAQPVQRPGCCWPAGRGYYLWLDGELWEFGADYRERKLVTLNDTVWSSRTPMAEEQSRTLMTSDGAHLYDLPNATQKVFLCTGHGLGLPRIGQIVALHMGGDGYLILCRERSIDGERRIELSVAGKVVGVALASRYNQAALVVQHPQHFQLLGADFSEIVEVGFPIAQACLHFDGLLGYRTQGGQLRCYDTRSQTHLWANSP